MIDFWQAFVIFACVLLILNLAVTIIAWYVMILAIREVLEPPQDIRISP